MNLQHRYFLMLVFFFAAIGAFTNRDGPAILMGPILHFNGQEMKKQSTWNVSALYLLKADVDRPLVKVDDGKNIHEYVKGQRIGTKLGYHYLRYDLSIKQTDHAQKISYGIDTDQQYHFNVPAIGQPHRILFHSCNGYQYEKDRAAVGGIAPMWKEINRRHQALPYVLQIGGGDQLYADGLVHPKGKRKDEPRQGKNFGVFALKSLQPWLNNRAEYATAGFTDEMRQEVDEFYFHAYIRQYAEEPDFKLTMATIPSVAQPDDHDFYDGRGSYPEFLQSSPVMAGIGAIGMWHAFTVQHQISAKDYMPTKDKPGRPYHFRYVINDGKLALFGIDTRTERTALQVASESSWKKIFKELNKLDQQIDHVIMLLGIPVVYGSTEMIAKAYASLEPFPHFSNFLAKTPGPKAIFHKNAFNLFELADDLNDGWGHYFHQKERDHLVAGLQEVAMAKKLRISLIGGDVHLGAFGTIHRKKGSWDNTTIAQITSSPVGNNTPPKAFAAVLSPLCAKEQKVGTNSKMCLHKLRHKDTQKKKRRTLIPHRNFVSMELTKKSELMVEWSAEGEIRKKKNGKVKIGKHKLYEVMIPPPQRSPL